MITRLCFFLVLLLTSEIPSCQAWEPCSCSWAPKLLPRSTAIHSDAPVSRASFPKFHSHNHGSPLYSASSTPRSSQPQTSFLIRKCRYSDLGAVSDIIVSSFYTDEMRRSPFSSVLKLGELNRLQQNFPYSDERHSMLVAIGTDNTVIGFVDLDNRPATRRIDPPRPYLSDLAVHLDYRRQGIATTLIETCQDMVLQQWQAKELYIRVERANHVAVQMYQRFDYRPMDHAIFGVEDTTVLLRKIFEANETTTLDYSV